MQQPLLKLEVYVDTELHFVDLWDSVMVEVQNLVDFKRLP